MSYIKEEYKNSDELANMKENYAVDKTKTPQLDPAYYQNKLLAKDVLNKLNNMKFSYDVNGDALYQQYKNQYMQQGKLAMQDTIAQAAAMTGGYGNSYAATAGNQAYQGYLTKLNDVIPELYQLAYDKFTDEKNDLRSLYDIYNGEAAEIYNMHRDNVNDWNTTLDRQLSEITQKENFEYGVWSDNETIKWNQHVNEQEQEQIDKEWKYTTEQDTKDDAKDMVLTLIGAGVMPDAALLKTAGISSKDAQALVDKTNASLVVNDGGDDFSKYTFAGVNEDNGKMIFYKDGEKYEFDEGINPYGAGSNPDAKYGTFKNGYQPNNVGGNFLSKTGEKITVNGVEQNIWKTEDGNKYYWDGTKGEYIELSVDDATQNIKRFINNLTPESQHDAIARNMYGSYSDYVDKMIEEALEKGKLSEEEAKYVIRTLL